MGTRLLKLKDAALAPLRSARKMPSLPGWRPRRAVREREREREKEAAVGLVNDY